MDYKNNYGNGNDVNNEHIQIHDILIWCASMVTETHVGFN